MKLQMFQQAVVQTARCSSTCHQRSQSPLHVQGCCFDLSDDNNLDVPSALEPSVHDLESESQLLIGQTAAQLPLGVP